MLPINIFIGLLLYTSITLSQITTLDRAFKPIPSPIFNLGINLVEEKSPIASQLLVVSPTSIMELCRRQIEKPIPKKLPMPYVLEAGIQLKSIFILLYYASLQIDFNGDIDEWLYAYSRPTQYIIEALHQLERITLTTTHINQMIPRAYEALHLLELVSFLPHASTLRTEHECATLENPLQHITDEEEATIATLHALFDPVHKNFTDSTINTEQTLATLLTLCKKMMVHLVPLLDFEYHPLLSRETIQRRYRCLSTSANIDIVNKLTTVLDKELRSSYRMIKGLRNMSTAERLNKTMNFISFVERLVQKEVLTKLE
ncbi:hypothetical protein FJ364_00315 [Candidatus Dependentiae bacterium]|nr:hypothetical protein [Candidatus Dependentiae bacterium]